MPFLDQHLLQPDPHGSDAAGLSLFTAAQSTLFEEWTSAARKPGRGGAVLFPENTMARRAKVVACCALVPYIPRPFAGCLGQILQSLHTHTHTHTPHAI